MQGIGSRIAMLDRHAHLAPRKVESSIQRIAPRGAPLRIVPAPPKRLPSRGTTEEAN
jgi:hypothetical protein